MSTVSRPAARGVAPIGWLLIVLLLGAVGWYLFHAVNGANVETQTSASAQTLELAPSDVVTASRHVLVGKLPISGSLKPLVQSSVKSKVAGEVLEITVREGQSVRQGDVLVRIDTRSQTALVASQTAALDKARADLAIARLNYEKSQRLFEKKFIAENERDTARSVHDAAVANVKLAEAQLNMAEIGLHDAVVQAPFDAVVARRFAEPGEKVSSDSPLLDLVDLSLMELQAAAPATEIPTVRAGQKAHVRIDGFGDRVFEARLERINPTTEQGSRQIFLYLAIDNADGALRGGMFAQGELVIEQTQPVLAIPASAVQSEAGLDYVMAIENGKLVRRQLSLGVPGGADNLIEVRAGLAEGAQLLAIKFDTLQPGTPVQISGAAPASAAASSH